MTVAFRSALRSAPTVGAMLLLVFVSAGSLQAQTSPNSTTPPKSPTTNPKAARPVAAPAKPATTNVVKPTARVAPSAQPKAQVGNSVGLVPAASRNSIQSAPATAKPNVASVPPANAPPTTSATAPPQNPTSTPTAAPAAAWSPTVPSQTAPAAVAPLASAPASAMTSGGDPRTPVGGLGVGSFVWPGGWTLTSYGCFRTDTRLFCDFDTTNQGNVQVQSHILWAGAGGVNLVDDGGKITTRHNAFFVGQDGSQFATAYVSPQPVRFIIEYDDVDPRFTTVSLILARERIQRVPVIPIDPNQPAGRMPPRAVASATTAGTQPAGQQTAQPGTTGALDKAAGTVNSVNDQKKKAQSLWKSLQGAVQSH